jgi:hypothetical protein
MMPIRQIIMSDDVANEECLNPDDFLKERESVRDARSSKKAHHRMAK